MIYLLFSILVVATAWSVITKHRHTLYMTIVLAALAFFFLYINDGTETPITLTLMLSYFCLISYGDQENGYKKDYKAIIKYIPIIVVILICLVSDSGVRTTFNEIPKEKDLFYPILISVVSILICFITVKTSIKRTRGNRDYD